MEDEAGRRKKRKSDVEKEHACLYVGCGKKFNRPYRLKQHVAAAHTKELEFSCPELDCDRTYASKYKLHLHLKTHHSSSDLPNKEDQQYLPVDIKMLVKDLPVSISKVKNCSPKPTILCEVANCKKMFSNKYSLKKHFNKCHLQSFTCDFCKKDFGQLKTLERHIFTHLEKITYKCEVCSKVFKSSRLLENHSVYHLKVKCPVQECSSLPEFEGSLALHKHFVSCHKGNLVCNFCNAMFCSKFYLARHMKHSHLTDNTGPFPCALCDKTYAFKKNLANHIKLHHQNWRFPCSECGRTFASKQKVRLHMKLHAPGYDSGRKYLKGEQRKRRKDAGLPKKSISELVIQSLPKIINGQT